MRKFIINVDGNSYEVEVEDVTGLDSSEIKTSSENISKRSQKEDIKVTPEEVKQEVAASEGQEVVDAPMPGNIWKVLVSQGDIVKAGDVLFILEAMKMENEIVSPIDGKVVSVSTTEGSAVNTGDKLAIVE